MLKKTSDFLDEYDKLANVDPKKQQQLDKENKYLQLLDLCSKEQFLRFKEINNETKVVFMVLLTSDHTYREDVISLIPIDELLSHQVFYPQILQYKIAESEVDPTNYGVISFSFTVYQLTVFDAKRRSSITITIRSALIVGRIGITSSISCMSKNSVMHAGRVMEQPL